MDDFVRNKLTEWGLQDLIDRFKGQGINEDILYELEDQDIKDLIPQIGPRVTFRNKLWQIKSQQEPEEAAGSDEVFPSTSATRERKSGLQSESSAGQQPKKRCEGATEASIRSDVKKIMRSVHKKLPNKGTKLNDFLRRKMDSLETDKRELIGVFGRTGAGKSSLINAIIGEEGLLATGDISACTSVMIKVESNPNNSEYQADIEFITPEDWKEEVWQIRKNKQKNDDDDPELVEKMTAVYGKEWKDIVHKNPLNNGYFREIPEFLRSGTKTVTCESAEDLSKKLIIYTRISSEDEQDEDEEIPRSYWPLVKCVTVKVPDNHLLQHVTLVDLPGSGDWNKSRDKMWKGIVRDCSTVWIVANIDRAASEKEAWEILENTCSLIGNGGQCEQIHFICTKSDVTGPSGNHSDVRDYILKRNSKTKERVKQGFYRQDEVKKHFSDKCFKVFTVSSKEFLEKEHLNPEDTEIPELQKLLKDLNDRHSETFNYVSRAHGILSLMHGANSKEGAEKKTNVCAELENNLMHQLGRVQEAVEAAHKAFETRLTEGVERSKGLCEETINSFLGTDDSNVYMTLKSVVTKDGVHKTRRGNQINLNVALSQRLTDSIDEEFRKTFPNEDKSGSFNGAIRSFSLDTTRLTEENKSLELQLTFLKTEEENIKTELYDVIRDQKKTIYSSLTDAIQENMKTCYKRAAEVSRGEGALRNMRKALADYVQEPKDTMFEEAKAAMLDQMNDLKEEILKMFKKTSEKSIELSLKTDDNSIPDVQAELEKVKKYYNDLKPV